MTTVKTDFVARVKRLPEPWTVGDTLQPLFEAVMNSIHSTQDKFGKNVSKLGQIHITVNKLKSNLPIDVIVQDNGTGLDTENYDAFLTIDTEHKKVNRGGKGVGRLLWLAGFNNIEITSDFVDEGIKKQRNFSFVLKEQDQIDNDNLKEIGLPDGDTGFIAKFSGLKGKYAEKFPQKGSSLFPHVLSHFLPVMVGNMCPQITVTYGNDSKIFPAEIQNYLKRNERKDILYEGNPLVMEMLECDKVVSHNLQAHNFVHFIAHDRTVHSQPIDGKLGLKIYGENEDKRVFHALLSGEFLNTHVNQQRTQFTFEVDIIESVIKEACIPEIMKFLEEPLKKVKNEQMQVLSKIVDHYPSVGFNTIEKLSEMVPVGETRDDELFGTLSINRYRQDKKQREKINEVIARLKKDKLTYSNFEVALKEASEAVIETERRSLAEYVTRRKVLINFLREFMKSTQQNDTDSDYQIEAVLHNFICPVRIKSSRVEAASHDLWIIDERLTFSKMFSSDVAFRDLLKSSKDAGRPDLLVFDKVYGLRNSKNNPYVLLVEFKRPGRQDYKDQDNPHYQIENYIKELQQHNTVDIDGRPIELLEDTRFHCFLIADRLGKLKDWTSSWSITPDGRGRIYNSQGDYKGFIELITWDQLIEDAYERNKAFFDKAGIN